MVIEVHAKITPANSAHGKRWVIWYLPVWNGRRQGAYESIVMKGAYD